MNLFKYINTTIFVLSCNFLIAQNSFDTQSNNFKETKSLKIIGNIRGLQENDPVVLYKYFHPFVTTSWKAVDTSYVKDGKFILNHYLEDGPRLLMLNFPNHNKMAITVLGNETINVTSSWEIDSIPNETIVEYLKFDGSIYANDFIYLTGIGRLWRRSIDDLNSEIRKHGASSSLSKENLIKITSLIQAKSLINNSVNTLFTNNFYAKRNAAICELFTECYDSDRKYDSLWMHVYLNLDEETKNTYYGKLLGEYKSLFVGQPAPNFVLNSEGKSESFKKIIHSNKITILHFWSNQSRERQNIHRELASVYQKYKPKGLEIVSVSLDANPVKWKKAIQEDKIPGIQSCDFKEEEGEAALIYKQTPKNITNILVDQNGKIIAWNIDGPELIGYLNIIFSE